MDFRSLLKQFAKNNNLKTLKEEEGRYTLFLDGNTVICYYRNQQAWFETDLGAAHEGSDADALNQLLLSRSMGFIRDQRACLSIDQETQHYCLHQRLTIDNLTPQDFQQALENFGGCLQYVTELIKQGRNSTPTHSGIQA